MAIASSFGYTCTQLGFTQLLRIAGLASCEMQRKQLLLHLIKSTCCMRHPQLIAIVIYHRWINKQTNKVIQLSKSNLSHTLAVKLTDAIVEDWCHISHFCPGSAQCGSSCFPGECGMVPLSQRQCTFPSIRLCSGIG